MNDAGGVRGGSASATCATIRAVSAIGSGPRARRVGQRLALVVGHRDERLAFGLADFVDRADVRVIQRAGSARFAQQPLSGFLARRGPGRKELQRDTPVQLRVLGEPDGAHPAGTEMAEDAVMRDRAANHVGILRQRAAARDLTS